MWPTPRRDIPRVVGRVTSAPATRMRPALGRRMPATAWISSLWPLPSTPAMPTISPASHRQRDAAHGLEAAIVVRVQVLQLEHRLAGPGRRLLDAQQHLAADHHLAPARAGSPRRRRPCLTTRPRRRTVTRSAIVEHLVELVRDEDDRRAARGQLAQDGEELERLLRREHGGRLVEDQDARVAVERLEDLDALLHADADVLDPARRDRRRGGGGPRARVRAPSADARSSRPWRARLRAEDHVLGDGHHRDQHEVLVHHADAERDRVGRRAQLDAAPVDHDLARVGAQQAVQHVHQRALARAVLPQQRVHLADAAGRSRRGRWRPSRRSAW